ncbi:MAG: hypothetical protein ACOY8P_07865 [Thermodesulfobacteriota bacterium]
MTLYRADIKLQWAKNDLLTRVNELCNAKMANIKAGYPEEEVKTWDQQVREALLYQANSQASVPMVAALALKRGLTVADMAGKIMAKATAFADISGQIIGHRQVLENTLAGCTTRQQLDAAIATIESGWPV